MTGKYGALDFPFAKRHDRAATPYPTDGGADYGLGEPGSGAMSGAVERHRELPVRRRC
jgi:hypothetical protein